MQKRNGAVIPAKAGIQKKTKPNPDEHRTKHCEGITRRKRNRANTLLTEQWHDIITTQIRFGKIANYSAALTCASTDTVVEAVNSRPVNQSKKTTRTCNSFGIEPTPSGNGILSE